MNRHTCFRQTGVSCFAALVLLMASAVCVTGQDAETAGAVLHDSGVQGGLVVADQLKNNTLICFGEK